MTNPMRPALTQGLFVVLLLIAACTPTETIVVDTEPILVRPAEVDPTSSVIPQKLRIGEADPIGSLDPLFARTESARRTVGLLYQGLVTYNAAGSLIPALAASWESDAENLVYTFRIDPQARYQDSPRFVDGRGRRVTAQDVQHAFLRMTQPSVPVDAANQFAPLIAGMDAYNREQRELFQPAERSLTTIQGIQVIDAQTVRFVLNTPSEDFLHLLATPHAFIYPRELSASLFEQPVGSGPYQYIRTVADTLFLFQYNPAYWSAATQLDYPQAVEVYFFKSEASIIPAIEKGLIDVIPNLPPSARRTLYVGPTTPRAPVADHFGVFSTWGTSYSLRLNAQNAAGLTLEQGSVLLSQIASDTLQTDLLLTDIRLLARSADTNPADADRFRAEYLSGSRDRMLTLAFTDSRTEGYLARALIRRIHPDMGISLVRSGVRSREITWFFTPELVVRSTATGQSAGVATPDVLLQLHVPRHALVHSQVDALQLNDYPWWLNLAGVRLLEPSNEL